MERRICERIKMGDGGDGFLTGAIFLLLIPDNGSQEFDLS